MTAAQVCPHCQLSIDACRSCGAKILWGKTSEGKAIPLDVEVRVVLNGPVGNWRGKILEVRRGHESHFATCPQAQVWRKTT